MSDAAQASGGGQADRKGIFGWMMFDWATQPFHTLIITFVFAPYFTSHVAESAVKGQEIWGYATGFGGLFIAFLAPVLGAIADNTGSRKPWIVFFSIFGVVGCWLLWFAAPGANGVTVAVIGVVLGLIGMEFAAVFNNAMMPDLVPRERLGRLSGSAWALGYIGGIVSLVIVLGFMSAPPETGKTLFGLTPIFGLDPVSYEGDRAAGPLSALWYVIFVLPMFLFTPDSHRMMSHSGAIKRGLRELADTLRALPSQRSYFSYLLSSMLYRDGLNALYAFGGIYAAGVLGWSIIQIGVFGILAAFTGVFGGWLGGKADDRYGPRLVVSISIFILTFCCLVIVSTSKQEVFFITVGTADSPSSLPHHVFYIAGCLIGASGAALQAASRTLLVDQVSPDRVTEAFGLYALSGKATTFVGPLLIAEATGFFESQRLGVTPVIVLFVLGVILLRFVQSAHERPSHS
ncbi:MFS transporter [Hoeflea prorocentri]|uniref:MFS transporter n=1 Tax=Hoeflea prorocentri TaxID=1922333 RepID=A0A9X3ZJ97_9HYPH|nr:MFS transporter [Hoeflea prorocentri]MCY6383219.1 MFS transporter [Hoeflea prorocentri]MDA5401019.1 MFS transporter [Hoeflea prorocentri]